ncbi:WecB/TagA/CpsF family glycosyltransferase [Fusibacter bizertensis]|jgi:N-acetylmannosaminyltransferase (EC 2.4.1.187)|uniref:N-acetylglucosaminyldiphosphoundecaprenol N-acetyl-beta-D-mannosaminyltransferase n=1 Tax=Fusibacter bizertensis TaxID=1488331 RepID=A0ABT6NB97_9FIRM|nr:WecB/TagA/CpsF family glycosyltransferase [Fusibacter bizertensis]MDH8677693.1 WecB/TagA/CpsF family glycosyltransferase [Fusibacter bizertensis]
MAIEKAASTVKIFGVRFDNVTLEEANKKFIGFMGNERLRTIYTPNPEIVMMAQEDDEFKVVLNEGDLVIPDGIGIVLASKVHHLGLNDRVPGIELMDLMLEYCNRAGKSIFLFGGKPGVAEMAAENIKLAHPNLNIVGTRDGYFETGKELKILDEINEKKPDILFVALGASKQEKWIHRYKKTINASVAMGVGGALDVWAGTVRRAPVIFQKLGLEWFYRLIKQPTRFKRMLILPKFMLKVLFTKHIED